MNTQTTVLAPTPKQLGYLHDLTRKAGVDFEAPADRRSASVAIARLLGRGSHAGPDKPTAKQMRQLRRLADATGETFAYPKTIAQASAEIDRMLGRMRLFSAEELRTDREDRRRERDDISRDFAHAGGATRHLDTEVSGYGSSATWRRVA
jgi:hypothetical protein